MRPSDAPIKRDLAGCQLRAERRNAGQDAANYRRIARHRPGRSVYGGEAGLAGRRQLCARRGCGGRSRGGDRRGRRRGDGAEGRRRRRIRAHRGVRGRSQAGAARRRRHQRRHRGADGAADRDVERADEAGVRRQRARLLSHRARGGAAAIHAARRPRRRDRRRLLGRRAARLTEPLCGLCGRQGGARHAGQGAVDRTRRRGGARQRRQAGADRHRHPRQRRRPRARFHDGRQRADAPSRPARGSRGRHRLAVERGGVLCDRGAA